MANGWNGDDPPAIVFTYAPGRSGSLAMDILAGFNGILQGEEGQQTVRGTVCPTNGYAGYNALAEPRRVGGTPMPLAYCRAHARRKLHDIYQKDGSEIAAEGLRRIAQIVALQKPVYGVTRPKNVSLSARHNPPR